MDIKTLRYFLAVAREQSILGAAKSLHMTQPPLSRAMSELEESLGKQLFLRGSRKITLTADGLLLRKRATEIIDLMDKTELEMTSICKKDIFGEVTIGSGEAEVMRLIAEIMSGIRLDYPGIKFNMYTGNANDVSERLDSGLLDFGVLISPADISKYNSIKLPSKATWGFAIPASDPLAAKESLTRTDLQSPSLIISQRAQIQNLLASWMKCAPEKLPISATFDLIHNAALLAEEGLGYIFTIDNLISGTIKDSSLVFRPLSPSINSDIYLVWKRYQVFSKASELFLERIRQELK